MTNNRMKHIHTRLLLFFMLTVSVTEAWAQGLSGTYFIANLSSQKITNPAYVYEPSTPENNYYLCPTEGWAYFVAPKSVTGTDNGQPFLTTYKCRDGVYDATKAVWTLEKHPSKADCYYIIQAVTGKYMISNVTLTGANGRRVRVHLETVTDPSTLDDMALFEITAHSGHYDIIPHATAGRNGSSEIYIVVNDGNKNQLTGSNSKDGGPTGYAYCGGIIGLYSHEVNAEFVFEETVVPPTFTVTASGTVVINYAEGTTVHYTTDGTTPTASSPNTYSTPITVTNAMGSAIKAIAVDNNNGNTSLVNTLPLHDYTYNIVDRSGRIAIKHTVKQAEGKPLTEYTDIPEVIRSPYLNGETMSFFSFSEAYSSTDQLSYENSISKTPSDNTNIYVQYTVNHLNEKILHLTGSRPFNIKFNGDYISDNSTTPGTGTFAHNSAVPASSDRTSLWYISGNDPYALQVKNAKTNNYFGFTTPSTLLLSGAPANKYFIIMAGTTAGNPATHEQLELMPATGDNNYYRADRRGDSFTISTTATGDNDASWQLLAYPVQLSAQYYLIDKANKLIEGPIDGSGSAKLELPAEWVSSLVTQYKYYKACTISGDQYLVDEEDRIETLADATDGNIYVTYDVSTDFGFDTTDDDGRGTTTYMLRFVDGESFKQEDGHDKMMPSAQKAVYPYSNGDACLYVYGSEQWNTQLSSGASTRSRWLWYVVSTNGFNDPYHVKIMSYQAQASSHNYFRTYPVEFGDGTTHVVTGVTTMNPNASAEEPTEYMIIKGGSGRSKLVTLNPIADGTTTERRTVTSFEQYWKNNPTVQSQLAEGHKVTDTETYSQNIVLTSTQEGDLPSSWHTYNAFANAAPWVGWRTDNSGTGKQYLSKNHWFQTINMASTGTAPGEFVFETVALKPQVILIDQHGWEIMRAPLNDLERLRQFNSPMVQDYHWYPTASKSAGYHKFTASNPNIPVYTYNTSTKKWDVTTDSITHTSKSLTDSPYDHFIEKGYERQDSSVMTDFYVTYTVKSEYANRYTATPDRTTASAVTLKQGGKYATTTDGATISLRNEPEDIEHVPEEMQWYMKPNTNIDSEMGYIYEGQHDEPARADVEAEYFANNQNGFDPYNVQIQSHKYPLRFFTTNTTGSALNGGSWKGTTGSTVTLQNMNTERQTNIGGYEQETLSLTNATFMVVGDANDNMRLMPRFDHTRIVASFNTLAAPAAAAPKNDNGTHVQSLLIERVAKTISSLDEIEDMGGYYILADGITFTSSFTPVGEKTNPFKGIIDGKMNTISGLTVPIIAYADGAVVSNVLMDDVSISAGNTEGNTGAIACEAKGSTRIYNCGILPGESGSSVGGSNNVGSLVGLLGGDSRVINCFSYANVCCGDTVAGIVGYNEVETTAALINSKPYTMVMNCMFYGDITSGSNASPVYGGKIINNTHGGLNNFNYYAYDRLVTKRKSIAAYNNALAAEEKYLNRFEFYRLLLNSNKKLAAYYATGDTANARLMKKWVLETADRTIDDPMPYPVLKEQGRYASIINMDVANAPTLTLVNGKISEGDRNKGGKIGTLSVIINSVGTDAPAGAAITRGSLTLDRTDKDYAHFNFNYDKVQLPYYNDVGTKNYTGNKVVTGWKITAITPVANDPYSSSDYPTTGIKDFGYHNYADRKSSNKDLYDVSKRVFSQGAYFDVPYGVSSITIEPYWGTAQYVADEYLDVVYNASYSAQSVTQLGKQFSNGKITIDGSEQVVYTSISTAVSKLSSSGSVYDNAIVLVGNVHNADVPSKGDTPFTMMSVDLDHDNEPDYSYIYCHGDRTTTAPIRFDFLDVPGMAQAQKPYGASQLRNAAVFKTRGWFELTNTSLMYFSQIEYENLQVKNDGHKKDDAPFILQGGVVDQIVSTQSTAVSGKTIYIHVGGNVWFKTFSMGTHGDGSQSTPHVPVSVTGGDYDSFYLTGTYNPGATVRDDNAECYISGGRFGEVAGAGQEQIGKTGTSTNGNIHWQIYDADINEFYGGGINDVKPVQGNITTDIFNSHVKLFCGGPKFGNMAANKKVITNANGCTFDQYFGAGNGGNSYSRKKYYDNTSYPWSDFNTWYNADKGKYFDGKTTVAVQSKYGYKGAGVATDIDYEFFVWTSGTAGVRFYVNFASFSLAKCNDVESNLTGCTVNEDFYGGGNLGNVAGTAKSVLDGCKVFGNVFGGGYSATLPEIPMRTGGFTTNPNFNSDAAIFEPGVYADTVHYQWKHVDSYPADKTSGIVTEGGKNYVVTTTPLDQLGQVGHTDLTVKGNTYVEGEVVDGRNTGGVFGGGDESAVNGNTKVTIQTTGEQTISNVYGGGNTADVSGNSEVTLESGAISHDIFGGGKGETTVVGGNVVVNIGTKDGSTYAGTGNVAGNVYGGSAFGNTNVTKNADWDKNHLDRITAASGKTTKVNLHSGSVTGSVFGGGLGQREVAAQAAEGTPGEPGYIPAVAAKPAIQSNVYGPVEVTAEGVGTAGNVFGCNDQNGAPQSTVKVFVKSTKAPDSSLPNPIINVYGGGNLAAYTGSPEVEMTGGTVNYIYGGGLGSSAIVTGNTSVTLSGGTVNSDVYGGGSEANVTGSVSVDISGGTVVHDVYGGGALANTNTDWIASDKSTTTPNTVVSVTGGTIDNVYGGSLGRKAVTGENPVAAVAAQSGNVLVELNKEKTGTEKGGIVNQIFGANNANGTPLGHVTVHVYATQHADKTQISDKYATPSSASQYDVQAVYGGGNEADYIPEDAQQSTKVIIEGCDLSSIMNVYGGGNAAAVPATDVWILGDKIIDNVFGGGNGERGPAYAAHVGYHRQADLSKLSYAAGSGEANTNLVAGNINNVYGGSNSNGDIRVRANVKMPQKEEAPGYTSSTDCCDNLITGHIYGGGKNADMSGGTNIVLGCMPNSWIEEIYAGAQAADVEGDVSLTITSGKFERVFGGNKTSGLLKGSITVNIEETGDCSTPIIIGELYGGGYEADYSVYGYKQVGDDWVAIESADDPAALTGDAIYKDPKLNILSFTSIGAVYGGGLEAKMVANPQVGINVVKGSHYNDETMAAGITSPHNLPYPGHEKGKIGSIQHVFGGGNLANVFGNTTVNVGTETTVGFVTEPKHFRESPETPLTKDPDTGLYIIPVEGAIITGSIYGGGNNANVTGNAQVNICAKKGAGDTYTAVAEGTAGVNIALDVFGAGKGSTTSVKETKVVIAGGAVQQSVYGGSELGIVEQDSHITVMGGSIGDPTGARAGATYGNVYGAGKGNTSDIMTGLIKGNTNITVSGGNVYHNIYGGGAFGSVGTYTYADAAYVTEHPEAIVGDIIGHTDDTGTANITITGGTIGVNGHENGMVFGSARGEVAAPGEIEDRQAWVYDTHVIIGTSGSETGPAIKGSLYGSGENGHTYNDAEIIMYSGVIGNPEEHYQYRGNVYGGGCGTDMYYSSTVPEGHDAHDGQGDTYNALGGIVKGKAKVAIYGGNVARNVYGAGAMGSVSGADGTEVIIGGTAVIGIDGTRTIDDENGYVYAAARGKQGLPGLAVVKKTSLTISGTSTVWGSAFGGGQNGFVTGSTTVSVTGGTVKQDVYGGGSLADVTGSVNVSVSGGKIVNNVYGGGAQANTNTANWTGDGSVQYVLLTVKADPTAEELAAGVLKTDVTPVAGYFTESAGVYTRITNPDAKANGSTSYYKKAVSGTWADGKTSASDTTTVSLTGGLVGNVYGGGLGNSTTMANVYGNVKVYVNKGVSDPSQGVLFNQQVEHPVIGGTDYPTPVMGRVFGCNNFNGTPTGEVTVHVFSTRQIRKDTEDEILPGHGSTDRKFSYDIQSVYGGGNQADYLPAAGKKSHVIIEGCDETSIEKVYGGCNSAVIPETDVLIKGCYDIGYGFGGGNGGRPIKKEDGNWYENEGAIVIGTARIECQGGKIGQVFGGGDSKGSCGSTAPVIPDQGTGTCPLWITRLYGAGNAGDVSHVNIILAACSGNAIEYVHGGSYNAHVHGDINLTITSGILKNVYGGNDSEGGIEGDITVNIEETDGCNPIIIQNLVGGGNEAAFPGTLKSGGVETPINRHGKITVNVKSATRIDNIYGGSFNAEANADTEININMMKGNKAGETVEIPKEFSYIPNISGISEVDSKTIRCTIDDAIGTIGNVFGGGKEGLVKGNTQVNINSAAKVYIMKRNAAGKVLDTSGNEINAASGENIGAGITIDCTDEHDVEGAHITGNVFGGGENADVTSNETYGKIGNAEVYICANKTGEGTYAAVAEGAGKVTVNNGSVYGGGSAADVWGNTWVTMTAGYIYNGIFGGGYAGSVGKFTRSTDAAHTNVYGHTTHAGCIGKPVSCADGTGTCTVVVTGGQIGPVDVAKYGMRRAAADGGPVPQGWVWGGGCGLIEDPSTDPDTHFKTYVNETYVTIGGTAFIQESIIGGGEFGRVLGDTHVNIEGNCQIGVGDGQWETVGGVDKPKRYDHDDFINPATATATQIETAAAKLRECSYFPYGRNKGTNEEPDWVYEPYDPYYGTYTTFVNSHSDYRPASTANPSNGQSWIGCVFGGGSGYMPYIKADRSGYEWCRSAGLVEGNATVQISGGHILTNVYGGNEYTDLMGTATVTMTGGTIGVPRTLTQIADHPMACFLFGGGKGDQRSHFNQWTDVGSVVIDVSGGIIYGSVFGGGEDGHVWGNASVTIRKGDSFTIGSNTYNDGPVIGTWGTSYVDGNVFGGGRGFSGETFTAGNVGGNVNVTITGGTILGSVYGGGRLGSVGYQLVASDDPQYGVMQSGDSHGHVTVDISDATGKTVIGNKYEFQYMTSSVDTSGKTEEQITAARKDELLTTYHVTTPDFSYNGTRYMINHVRGGCVYGGGMGRRELLNGAKNTIVDWTKLGNVQSTKVNIHGDDIWIKGSVFGGGEFGAVTGSHTSLDDKTVGTEVIINGNLTIGSVIGTTNNTYNATLNTDNRTQLGSSSDENRYTYGGAYAGGFGTDIDATMSTPVSNAKIFGAYVSGNTSIKLLNGAVRSSIYGGGKVACVGGDTYVTVSGGDVGVNQVRPSNQYVLFGGMRMGNVYGGGRGSTNSVVAGLVKGNTNVTVSGGGIYHNIYGGGALGSVGNFSLTTEENKASYGLMYANLPVNWTSGGTARVTVTGGTIGINGHDNGMVYGSSRGDISTNKPASIAVSDVYDHLAWVKNTIVTIGTAGQGFDAPQPQIKGSVYGGGENGHNSSDAEIYVHSGTIGVVDTNADTWSNRGSVFGAGCGTDTYEKNADGTAFTDGYNHHNPMGGRVQGNTTITVDGGHILRSVYGAGSMGSVDGNATVTVSGGRIGTDGAKNNDGISNGDVFGGPKGSLKLDPSDSHAAAHVESTTVTVNYATTPATDDGSTTHLIAGSVYGGGEAGLARGSVTVNMNGGLVKNNLYGGGALASTNTSNWNASANTWADGKITTVDGKRVTTHKTTVNLAGGRIMHDAYGGALGQFAKDAVGSPGDPGYKPAEAAIEPCVYGDILVELNKDVALAAESSVYETGCIVENVFGCNDMQGTPKGHVKVHVYATQHSNTTLKPHIDNKFDKFPKVSGYAVDKYDELTDLADAYHVNVSLQVDTLTSTSVLITEEHKKKALANMETAVAAAVYSSYATSLGVSLTGITGLEDQREAIAEVKYDVQAVYGGGNLAPYVPADALSEDEAINEAARSEVVIDGCELTSIKEVYGSGNAASTPATLVTVNGTHEIDELFGGGNGKDNYQIGTTHYENPGANVGYYNYTTVYKPGDTGYTDVATNGSGSAGDPYKAIENENASSKDLRINNYSYGYGLAETNVYGGRIHNVYGGSNSKGNIRDMALSVYDDISTCELYIDKSYGAGKNAEIDGEINVQLSCVDYMAELYGGSTTADVNADVTLTVTNGTFGKVFGGNDQSGTITGSITVNVRESGCRPIIIGELYGAGNQAPYSVYGYNSDKSGRTKAQYEADVAAAESAYTALHPEATREELDQELMRLNLYGFPKRDLYVNIISATKIGTVYGGGLGAAATVIGNAHVNVNMEHGRVLAKYANNEDNSIKTEYTVAEHTDARGDKYTVYSHEAGDDAILEIGTIGDIFGGGNASDIIGNTSVEIGTGTHHNDNGDLVTIEPARNAAFITGNVYGGGKMGHVGDFTMTAGKPTSCAEGTGICTVIISNGDIGPDNMNMWHLNGSGNVPADDNPDNKGHVFGGGQGSNAPANDNDAFVDSTSVTINGTAWVKGSVFGGGEDGHVLHNAGVRIGGSCQIGNGHILLTDGSGNITLNRGVNRRYTAAEWEAGHLTATAEDFPDADERAAVNARFAHSLPECDSWLYGKKIVNNQIVDDEHHAPYDKFAKGAGTEAELGQYVGGTTSTGGGRRVASNGRSFNGSVYGGGSGFFPYSASNWNPKAGQVEGNTWVEVTGGHIMTSLYGGNEMSTLLGDAHVKMTGGTVGVPRTLDEIAAHPVTCYVFGGGKGEERDLLDDNTDVQNTFVTISGGWVYGSVFGGAEDGHVLGDAKVTISGTAPTSSTTYAQLMAGEATKIGTWGTSYVEGNIFGGGRGFDGHNSYSGNIGGNVEVNIQGGEMLGSVYGGGRLGSVGYDAGSTMQAGDGHGNIVINISGSPVIGNDLEYVYWRDGESPDLSNCPNTPFDDWTSFTEKQAEDEDGLITTTVKTRYKRLDHAKGGNVFGGSMGRINKINGKFNPIWGKLGHAKSTTVTVTGGTIKSSVYGGSEMGQVEGNASVSVSNATIGSEVKKTFAGKDITQYTFGCIYGGGYGSGEDLTDLMAALTPEERTAAEALSPLNPREYSGQVGGSTTVNMSGGWVKASVFGGGKIATVNNNATVTVSGGEVGLNKVRKSDGYVMYGGSASGNVYGGGQGSLVYPLMGVVKGNTNITISDGSIYHNVYGGGALASVGRFSLSNDDSTSPDYYLDNYVHATGIPVNWTPGTGKATINITGGTIGISGRDNGMVNGSSRGDIATLADPTVPNDPYDKVAWVNETEVNIGSSDPLDTSAGPHIIGSVYGGGENGHNYGNATVNVYKGTIGITDETDPWYTFADPEVDKKAQTSRGNVYGSGCGTDTYTITKDGKDYEYHNPWSGIVRGNTTVNVYGGIIAVNVYGGGSIGSVGTITNAADTADVNKDKHADIVNPGTGTEVIYGFGLSWPYEFKFKENTGKATVNIEGGHIGLTGTGNGDVYGSTRGEAGDRYATAHQAYVNQTEVTINYPATADVANMTDFDTPCVTGSVHGSGENGYVYGNTEVTLNKGLVGHALYGGGKGKGKYPITLIKLKKTESDPTETYTDSIYSLISGKVFGNTHVVMNDGLVVRNVYGGGNIASVGKGNYAGGADDYYTKGYGETLFKTGDASENLWDNVSDYSKIFLNSGKTLVEVKGGTVGYINSADPSKTVKNDLPYGNVFGGSHGEPAPNVKESPRYHYCPTFFSGYVNETDVRIGADGTEGPLILGSVYGGGQDGHVRRDTKVTVSSGEIGLAYNDTNRRRVGTFTETNLTKELDNLQWMYRGNVFGAGSGISKYEYDFTYDHDFYQYTKDGDDNKVYTLDANGNKIPQTSTYNSKPISEVDYSSSAGSVTRFTEVNILGGTIHRNVYGGGSLASVGPPPIPPTRTDMPYKKDDADHGPGWQSMCTVNISGTIGSPTDYHDFYGGEVYGASRGFSELSDFGSVVWTLVQLKDGANVKGNVFGGGDNGMVKQDTDVRIGE